jgi:hypothetical protein
MRLTTVQPKPFPLPLPTPAPAGRGRLVLSVLPVLLAASFSACSSRTPSEPQTPSMLRSVIGAPPRGAQASPAVWGAERGLELWSWTVADARQPAFTPAATSAASLGDDTPPPQPAYTIIDPRLSIELAVLPYTDRPVPIADDLRYRLHAAGFRIVAVPVADLPALQSNLRLVAPTQKQWLGEIPLWTDLVSGPTFHFPRTIAIDNTPLGSTTHLQPGRLRLLGRAWTVPLPTADNPQAAAMRLELVPQHEPQLSDHQRLLAGISNTRTEAEGRLFPGLAVGAYLRGEDALILIPDSPHSDWSSPPPPPLPAPTPPEGNNPADPPDAPHDFQADSAINWPTLGEAMLAAPARGTTPRTRAVLVLIPHIPSRFELR